MVKIDKSHKTIDLRYLDMKKARELGLKIGSTALTLFMLSGCGKKEVEENVNSVEPIETSQEIVMDETVPTVVETQEIVETTREVKTYDIKEHNPSELVNNNYLFVTGFDDDRRVSSGDLTYDDLAHVVNCTLMIKDDGDYELLNHMPALQNISIMDLSTENKLDNIDGSRLPSGINITIRVPYGEGGFTREKFGFLEDAKDIGTLQLGGEDDVVGIDSKFVQDLRQVHNLKLIVDYHTNFKYDDLSYLDSLELCGKPYDIAIYFSTKDLEEIEKSGVVLKGDNLEAVKSVDKELDEIVEGLNISENATVQEKLNAILTYVLSEYEYDENIHQLINNGVDVPDEMYEPFYGEGYLMGGMKGDSQICGNYAAMTTALLKRVDVDSFNMTSKTHAWVAVQIGDYYFYCDPTWIDGDYYSTERTIQDPNDPNSITIEFASNKAEEAFINNDTSVMNQFSWYLVDPTEVDEIKTSEGNRESHDIDIMPYGFEIKDIPEEIEAQARYEGQEELQQMVSEEVVEDTKETEQVESVNDEVEKTEDISKKEFRVNINGKTIAIGAGAFVGVLAAIGGGVLVHKKKEEERRRRRRQQLNNMFSDPYSNPYDRRRRRY